MTSAGTSGNPQGTCPEPAHETARLLDTLHDRLLTAARRIEHTNLEATFMLETAADHADTAHHETRAAAHRLPPETQDRAFQDAHLEGTLSELLRNATPYRSPP